MESPITEDQVPKQDGSGDQMPKEDRPYFVWDGLIVVYTLDKGQFFGLMLCLAIITLVIDLQLVKEGMWWLIALISSFAIVYGVVIWIIGTKFWARRYKN